ncbi:MAG: hypothetical protein Q4C76_06860 [Bacillota bacterium]|nr:hypothetical protein [Bacillota bacterium]
MLLQFANNLISKRKRHYSPVLSEVFETYMLENIPINYNGDTCPLQDVFKTLNPGYSKTTDNSIKIKLDKDEYVALMDSCRQQYLDHLSTSLTPSHFQSMYQPLINYIKSISSSVNQGIIQTYIRQRYIYSFSTIIAEYLLEPIDEPHDSGFEEIGYLTNWINAKIYEDRFFISQQFKESIQVIQYWLTLKSGTPNLESSKAIELIDQVITIIQDYAADLPQKAIQKISNLVPVGQSILSPEDVKQECEAFWGLFSKMWNYAFVTSSDYNPLPQYYELTSEVLENTSSILAKEFNCSKYLRPKNVQFNFTSDNYKSCLQKYIDALNAPNAVGSQTKLLHSIPILLDSLFTVVLNKHIEQGVPALTQTVERLCALYAK